MSSNLLDSRYMGHLLHSYVQPATYGNHTGTVASQSGNKVVEDVQLLLSNCWFFEEEGFRVGDRPDTLSVFCNTKTPRKMSPENAEQQYHDELAGFYDYAMDLFEY